MKNAYQQGQADGMCGLYAVLNFLCSDRKNWGENANNTMWYLLDACRNYGWLTPQYLTEGFWDHQLKSILDLLIQSHRMPYETYYIDDVFRSRNFGSFIGMARAVLRKRGSVIARIDSRYHWVLIRRKSGEDVVIDSGNRSSPTSSLVNGSKFDLDCGFIVLPKKLPKLEIDL